MPSRERAIKRLDDGGGGRALDVSTFDHIKLGLTVVPVMLLAGALLIWLRL